MRTHGLPVAVAIVCGASCLLAHAEQTNTLDSLRTVYESAASKIHDALSKQRGSALDQYGKALDALLLPLKQSADIQAYTEVEKERIRFQTERTIPTNSLSIRLAEPVAAYRQLLKRTKPFIN